LNNFSGLADETSLSIFLSGLGYFSIFLLTESYNHNKN